MAGTAARMPTVVTPLMNVRLSIGPPLARLFPFRRPQEVPAQFRGDMFLERLTELEVPFEHFQRDLLGELGDRLADPGVHPLHLRLAEPLDDLRDLGEEIIDLTE